MGKHAYCPSCGVGFCDDIGSPVKDADLQKWKHLAWHKACRDKYDEDRLKDVYLF